MRKTVSYILLVALFAFSIQALSAQQLSFRSINNDKGISGLGSWNCTFDHRGFLWISTQDGLVRFNGHEVKYFYHQDYPGLPTDQINSVFCDSRNQIWVCSDKGVAVVNPYAQISKVNIADSIAKDFIRYCMEAPDGTMYAMTFAGSFAKGIDDTTWISQPWLDTLLEERRFRDVRRFDEDRYLISIASKGVLLINLKTKSLETFFDVKGIYAAYKFDDHHIIFGGGPGFKLYLADTRHPDSIRTIAPPSFFNAQELQEEINYIVRAVDGNVYIATYKIGLLTLDSTLTQYHWYKHDPANPTTIGTNSLRYLTTNETGILAIASLDGINYTSINNRGAEYINYMKLENGQLTDEPVFSLAEDIHHHIWVCTHSNVYIYDPVTRSAHPMKIPVSISSRLKSLEPISVTRDSLGQMWVALANEGILVFNAMGEVIKFLKASDYEKNIPGITHVRIMRPAKDGYIYAGASDGFFRFTTDKFLLDTFPNDPLLNALKNQRVVDILPREDELWVSTSPNGGLWHYAIKNKKLDFLDDETGLPSNRIYGLTENGDGHLYIGSYSGFSIISPDGEIQNMLKGSGLVSTRVEAIETAKDGAIWLTNTFCLLKYDPVTKKIFRLSGRQGINHVMYSIMGSTKLSSGELAFGTRQGFLLIDPNEIKFDEAPLSTLVFFTTPDKKEMEIKPGTQLHFNYKHGNVRFNFAVNDLLIADDVIYRYRLSDREAGEWSIPSANTLVDFNLGPGYYKLEVESYDGTNWYVMPAPISFTIHPPWWKTWWFYMLSGSFLLSIMWLIFRERIKKYKHELLVTRQIAELESKALRAQMNPHFVFNSLNAIQECIVTGKIDEAYTYLSKFSRLLRMVLEHSDMSEVSLQAEMEVLTLYVSLEKLRFKDEMIINFEIDEELDTEEILIAPMLIQPHIENAIWHGLRDQSGEKLLTILINEKIPGYLDVVIADNGIGREKAASLKKSKLGRQIHQSKGSALSGNRMMLLKNRFPMTSISIEDLHDEQGSASGTRVHLVIPILEKNSLNFNANTS